MSAGAAARESFAEQTRSLLRERTFAAIDELLATSGWAAVSMAQVAAGAGVSRQTLYTEFGTREQLTQAYVLHASERFVERVEQAVAAHLSDPRAALAAAFDVFLTAAAGDPLVRAAIGGEGDELLALFTTRGAPVLAAASERLATFLGQSWPQLKRADAVTIADVVVRLAISHAALPGGSAKLTSNAVADVLGPFVDERLGTPRRRA